MVLRVRPVAPASQQLVLDVQLTPLMVSLEGAGSGVCVQTVPFQRIANALPPLPVYPTAMQKFADAQLIFLRPPGAAGVGTRVQLDPVQCSTSPDRSEEHTSELQ